MKLDENRVYAWVFEENGKSFGGSVKILPAEVRRMLRDRPGLRVLGVVTEVDLGPLPVTAVDLVPSHGNVMGTVFLRGCEKRVFMQMPGFVGERIIVLSMDGTITHVLPNMDTFVSEFAPDGNYRLP